MICFYFAASYCFLVVFSSLFFFIHHRLCHHIDFLAPFTLLPLYLQFIFLLVTKLPPLYATSVSWSAQICVQDMRSLDENMSCRVGMWDSRWFRVAGRREVPHRHAEWQQLWYSNFEEYQRIMEPNFDSNTTSNITVQMGATAFLYCRVRNLGERTVSADVRVTPSCSYSLCVYWTQGVSEATA